MVQCLLYIIIFCAVQDEDFSVTGGLTATFLVGDMNGATACLTISIMDDNALEGPHAFTVMLVSVSAPGSILQDGITSTIVNIEDNDGWLIWIT